ncbi:MAG: serine/threonine protein kinase [Chloroflexi bacterium OLB14]|nr:MAG: serine/threonine protein kinase [Chloroflexi bacterium OLB14]
MSKNIKWIIRFSLSIVWITLLTSCLSSNHQINDIQTSSKDDMTMLFIPAGEFMMGSETGLKDEQPAHKVRLDAFWMDKTEVTNDMYRLCVEDGSCKSPSTTTYYDDQEFANHPVVFVSWVDATNYCTWAGRRLPTEAEWEKAATWNASTNQKTVYPWGNDYGCKLGNFDDETQLDASLMPNTEISCDGFVKSSPAGSFPNGASPYGVLDMGGNVWEWVHDAFIEVDPLSGTVQNYYAISPYENPTGVDPAITEYRVMRGGSWNFMFGFGRSAYRLWYGKDDVYDGVGFRCASSE